MILIDSFDIFSDFWKSNPQLRVLFKEEYDNKVPSEIMWALFLYYHPKSKFFNEAPATRLKLIKSDYLNESSSLVRDKSNLSKSNERIFELSDYEAIADKIKQFVLSKAERSLLLWEQKLHERDALIAQIPYTMENFEDLDKLVTNSGKIWDQYFKIQDQLSKEQETRTEGDIEESLSEKKLI